jgi:MFS family permease
MKFPSGVRTVAWATAIRWFGWGLVEALLPIYMYRFTGNYLETALITGAFYLFFILTLPFAGVLADKVNTRTLLLTSLALYVFVGLGYFVAGYAAIIYGVILGRMLNGVAYGIDIVSRFTYYRRHTAKEHSGRVFGYALALGNSLWMTALVLSLFVVDIVPIHYLFLGISITAIIAWFVIYFKLAPETQEKEVKAFHVFRAYKNVWHQVQHNGAALRTITFLSFTLGFLGIITSFFIPLYIYAHGENLRQVVFIMGITVLPSLFGRQLGALVDKLHIRTALSGFLLLIPFVIALPFAPYAVQLVLAFCISAVLHLLSLTQASVVTHVVHESRYGRVEGVLQVMATIGTIIGSIVVGAFSQLAGQDSTFWFLAVAIAAAFIVIFKGRKHLMPAHAEL